MALVELDDEENRILEEYFPTTYVVPNFAELPRFASAIDLDLIISANSGNAPRDLADYLKLHLILLSKSPCGDLAIPTPDDDPNYYYDCSGNAESKQYSVAADLDPLLERALADVLPDSALGAPILERIRYGRGHARDPNDEGWLAWAHSPRSPLCLNFRRKRTQSFLAWFPQRPQDCVPLVKALTRIWARLDREAFPSIIDWPDEEKWRTAVEREVHAQRAAAVEALERAQQVHQQRITVIDERLRAAKEAADLGPRSLLTKQDSELVRAVSSVLCDLGFEVKDVDATREAGKIKREDLQIRLHDAQDWVAIVEVKGHRKRGANDDDLTKIERHVQTFMLEEKRLPSLKIYVCNAQFALSPESRQRPYASNEASVSGFCNGPVEGVIVPTPDLFRLHRDLTAIGAPRARELLLTTRGVFKYP